MNTSGSSRASFNNIILIFEICGIWIPEKLDATRKRFYILYVVFFSIVIYYSYVLSQVINLCMVSDNLEEFTESTFVFITVLSETIKALAIQTQQCRIKKLLNELDDEIFMPKTADERKILQQGLQKIKNICRLFFYSYDGTVILWGIFPLFDTERRHSLPLKAWYPFSLDTSPTYELVYLHQFIATLLVATLNAALDTTIICLMIHGITQLDILLAKLMNGYAGYVKNDPDGTINNEEENKMMFLRKFVIHHEAIIRYVQEVESIFNFCILMQFSMSALIICITMFQMTVEKPFSVQFLSTFVYQCCMLSQLFFYCWYGNELTYKSTMIPHAAYFSDWYEQNKRYCRTIQIIMIRASKPLQITGGYFFALSLETFTTILRSAWSYFTLLKQFHNAE